MSGRENIYQLLPITFDLSKTRELVGMNLLHKCRSLRHAAYTSLEASFPLFHKPVVMHTRLYAAPQKLWKAACLTVSGAVDHQTGPQGLC